MGVIQRQGFKSSIVSYIGVAIGAVSTVFVYPQALELLGLFRSLYDAAVLVGIVVLLGSTASAVRFFPKYKDPATGHHGLLSWLLIVSGCGFLFFLVLFPFITQFLVKYYFHEGTRDYQEYIGYLIPLTFFVSLVTLLVRYTSNFRRVAIPTAFEQLTIKILMPLIFLMFLAGWLTVRDVVMGIIASFALAAIGLIFYLKYLGEWRLTKPAILSDNSALKEYRKYSGYGLLSGIGSMVAFRIDSLMIAGMIQFQAAGIYAIAFTLSEIIIKPMRALTGIAGPVLAHHIEEGNMDEVKNIYRKSSLNMTIIGVGLFLFIWTILPYLFTIMSNSDIIRQGTYVVFFLGLSQVWDMMTGVNNELISYSRHFRFTLYATLFLGVLNIITNYFLIQQFEVVGAALATCISMFLFNVAKLIFIKFKFGFFPFSSKLFPVIAFGIAAWFIAIWMPVTGKAMIDLVIKGGVFCLVYGLTIWRLKISPDINHWVGLAVGQVVRFKSLFTKS
jgi:O-antigen/teichoic acid export membrane protein